jgi:membrane protease YdiL (CAAX protease family)
MEKIQKFIVEHPVPVFLLLTLCLSLISFFLMRIVPKAESPESFTGLPVWLIVIWSPNIAAIVIWLMKQVFTEKIQLAFSFPKFSCWMLLALIPILITFCLLGIEIFKGNKIEWSNFQWSYLAPLILINFFMGPLGEELGWRSFLYPNLKNHFGWMAAALIVGVVWALWHAPLWWIDSPQSKIPF